MRLTRKRWYNADGQRELSRRAATESKGTRKVVSLVVLLILVVLCMQQLSDPKKYEPAFQAVGLSKPAGQANANAENAADTLEKLDSSDLSSAQNDIPIDLARIWLKILEPTNQDVLRSLATAVFLDGDWQSESNRQVIETDLQSFIAQTQTQLDRWQTEIQQASASVPIDDVLPQFQNAWQQFRESKLQWLPTVETPLGSALKIALDRVYLNSFEDASFWQSTETLPFARMLQKATRAQEAFQHTTPTAVEELSQEIAQVDLPLLTKEMNTLRGRLVKVRGYVARSESNVITKTSVFGSFHYQIVWIRPETSSSVPIGIYLPCSSDSPVNFEVTNDRLIEFIAFPVKRLAYRAVESIEVAPVLFGLTHRYLPNASDLSQSETDTADSLARTLQTVEPNLFLNKSKLEWTSPTQLIAVHEAINLLIATPMEELAKNKDITAQLSSDVPTFDETLVQDIVRLLRGVERCKASFPEEMNQEAIKLKDYAVLQRSSGVIKNIESIPLPASLRESVELDQVYRLSISSLDSAGESYESKTYAFSAYIPEPWTSSSQILQPIGLHGLNWINPAAGSQGIWFVDRPEWIVPSSWTQAELSQMTPAIDRDLMPLAKAQLDLGSLDIPKSIQKSRILPNEKTSLFGLMAACSRESIDNSITPATIIDCLQQPEQKTARTVAGQSVTVRITRIPVETSSSQELLGSNCYYEINTLSDIGKQAIRLVSKGNDEPIVFEGRFPTTILIRELPTFLQGNASVRTVNESSESWQVNVPIEFRGRFYRLWSYRSDQTEQRADSELRQIAPLIIAESIQQLTSQPDSASKIIVGLSFGIIATLLAAAWLISRVIAQQRSLRRSTARAKG